ncbi:MAG: MBL fold metallo-hydrolase [Candidatus Micrarchaeota archaeon]|nr:MBL fold metallo-hydrolase [Candidatus Micrarchaeota archaeon]
MGFIRYIGHSSFELQLEDKVVCIDPFFSDMIGGQPRLEEAAGGPEDIIDLDFLFITHEHRDHFEKETVESLARRTKAKVIAPKTVLCNVEIPEHQKVDVQTGDRFEIEGLEVEVTKAVHPQSSYPVGYVIGENGKSAYHAGDTYEFREMLEIKADWGFIPIGGSFTMDPLAALKACGELRIKYAVPIHYNTYSRIKQTTVEFTSSIRGPKPVVMRPGQTVRI